MSMNTGVVTSIMNFVPEVLWYSAIKNVLLKRIYDILVDCFDLSDLQPAVIPKSRDVADLSAGTFVYIELQRRCIARYEEYRQDNWTAVWANHPPVTHRPRLKL